MKVTVHDVAAAANVSIGTVSRVLNNDPNVSADTAARVREAMKAMNYKRLRARSRSKAVPTHAPLSGRTVGTILLGMSNALSTLPVVVSAVQGVELELTASGATMRLVNCPSADMAETIMREDFDGLIVKGALQGDLAKAVGPVVRQRLAEVPTIWLLGRPAGMPGDNLCADDWRVGQLAAEHLLAHGHRTVAYLNPKADHANFVVRGSSFKERIVRGGGQVQEFLGPSAQEQPFPLQPVSEVGTIIPLLDSLLAARPRPTAVFLPADNIASLVYRAAAIRGVIINRNLSVISCNSEQSVLAGLHPSLTTIDIHAEMIGQLAVKQLARRLAVGSIGEPPITIQIEPRLVIGDSVRDVNCPPGRASRR